MQSEKSERLKRGAIRDDGKVFWAYYKHLPNGEYWVSPERYKTLSSNLTATRKRLRSIPEYLAKEYRGAKDNLSKKNKMNEQLALLAA